jgi:hypothetical protein
MSNALKEFRQDDADAMKLVEREIVKTVVPFREKMPPELVAFSLLRCCRTVLRLCNKNDQKELLPVMVAFLEGKVSPPEGESILWTPGRDVM